MLNKASRKNNQYIVIILLCIYFAVANAANLVASVDNATVAYGDSVQLKLQLQDAKATDALDISALAKDFVIYNSQQYSSYVNTNGIVKSESGWHVVLMPKRAGEFVIPVIALQTDKGLLQSQSIKITVQQGQPGQGQAHDVGGISLTANVSKTSAYVKEPIIYTLKMLSYDPIINPVLEDIQANDAIVEKVGEAKQYEQVHGGVRAHIIDVKYAITPLHAGKITVTPALMHGELQVAAVNPHKNHPFGLFNNLFHSNVFTVKPFSIQGEELELSALPVPIKTKQWLPLRDLKLSETWEGLQNVKVGDTITRKIKMDAIGNFGNQLPNLQDSIQHQDLKIYANKPVTSDRLDPNNNTLIGTRTEEYSLIAQKAGVITLPEVKVVWWNLQTKQLTSTTLPAKTINIIPAAASVNNVTVDYSADKPVQLEQDRVTKTDAQKSSMFYAAVGACIGILSVIGIYGLYLAIKKLVKKLARKEASSKLINKEASTIIISSALDLRKAILQHAAKHWRLQHETTLQGLGEALVRHNYRYDNELYTDLSKQLNTALYAGVDDDLPALKAKWEQFRTTVIKTSRKSRGKTNKYDNSHLNPT